MLTPLKNFNCSQELKQQLQNTHITGGDQVQHKGKTFSH